MAIIKITDLDPILTKIGLLVGLLDNSSGEVAVNMDWFNDPLKGIQGISTNGNGKLFDLIEDIFPKEGSANGAPSGNDWYAISYPKNGSQENGGLEKTPLHLIRKYETDAETNQISKDLVGVGFKGEYGNSVVVRPYLFVPVFNKDALVVGDPAHPIELGVEIKRGDSASELTFGTKAFSFTGLKVSVKFFFLDRVPEISDIMLSDLVLAEDVTLTGFVTGQPEVGLIELFGKDSVGVKDWMDFIFDLLMAEITGENAGPLGMALGNLRLLLGLSKGNPARIPSLQWSKLSSKPVVTFNNWFAKIFYKNNSRKIWLNALQCLIIGKDAALAENVETIQGVGTSNNPYILSVLSSWGGSSFDITIATGNVVNGKKPLSLEFRLSSEFYRLAHGIGVQFLANVEAGNLQVGQRKIGTASDLLRVFDLGIRVSNRDASFGSAPLFKYTPYPTLPPLPGEPEPKPLPDTRLTLGALHAGIRVNLEGSSPAPVPALGFSGITLGEDKFDVDLLTLKKTPQGGAATESFTNDNLNKLLEVLGGALQGAWDAYQPSNYASLETNIERIVRGEDYKSIIDKLLELSGAKASDIPALLKELADWMTTTEINELPEKAFKWLIEGGNVFGVVGGLLSIKIPEFSGEGSILTFNPWRGFLVSIGKNAEKFGMWLCPHAELKSVSLSGETAIIFQNGVNSAPEVTASVQFGLAEASLTSLKKVGFDFNPELALAMGSNASSLAINIYPLGSSAPDAYLMSMLPSPYLAYKNAPSVEVGAGEWMLSIVPRLLVPFFEDKLLNDDSVKTLLESKLLTDESPDGGHFNAATVLVDWGVLARDIGLNYRLPSFGTLSKLKPEGLFKSIVTEFEKLENPNFRLLSIGSNGDGIYFMSQDGDSYKDYGLRLQISDIAFGATSKISPKLQLGSNIRDPKPGKEPDPKEFSERWKSAGTGPVNPSLGLTINFLRLESNQNPSFNFGMELFGVGLDLEAVGEKTLLFDVGGVSVTSLKGRTALSLKLDDDNDPIFDYGLELYLNEMSLPLEKIMGKGSSSGSNPVAGNLLSGGNTETNKSDNPKFSTTVSYNSKSTIEDGIEKVIGFNGVIHSELGASDAKVWFPLDKTLGPLQCRQVGLGFDADNIMLWLGFDGSVTLAGLKISLMDLALGLPLEHMESFKDYKLALAGIDISYKGGPVEISGAFLEEHTEIDGKPLIIYSGGAILKAETFTISGLGSYTSVDGQPSMFIFALYEGELGGPTFFSVQGLAAGFGYNRKVRMPEIEEVENFPFVKLAMSPPAEPPSLEEILTDLTYYITPSIGDYWLAVGVKFNSFKLVDSFALMIASFGKTVDFRLDILGISKLVFPVQEAGKEVPIIAEVRMAFQATFAPAEGFLGIRAQLIEGSYIMSKDCILTGGFAFYSWFDGPHAGDFVQTMGGYHPSFKKPAHYPDVPRIGFNWNVSSTVVIKGEMYFALTPTMVMAGGRLEASYKDGSIRAWFIIGADFLISWEPFFYDARFYISIGAEYKEDWGLFDMIISIEVGADVHVWGPEFRGTAKIDLCLFSVDVTFGADDPIKRDFISWESFQKSFLPPAKETCAVFVNKGLIRTIEEGDVEFWIINPKDLVITTDSAIPLKKVTIPKNRGGNSKFGKITLIKEEGKIVSTNGSYVNQIDFGIEPVGLKYNKIVSTQTVTIKKANEIINHKFQYEVILKNVPEALWKEPGDRPANTNLDNNEGTLKDALAGLKIIPASPPDPGSTKVVDRDNLAVDITKNPNQFEIIKETKVQKLKRGVIEDGVIIDLQGINQKNQINKRNNIMKLFFEETPEFDLSDINQDCFMNIPMIEVERQT